jgi:hypothetical protein
MPFQTARRRIASWIRGLHDAPRLLLLWLAASGQRPQGSAQSRLAPPGRTAWARACCWAQRIDEARQRYRFCLDERPTAVADAAVGGGCWALAAAGRGLSPRARLCRPLRREQRCLSPGREPARVRPNTSARSPPVQAACRRVRLDKDRGTTRARPSVLCAHAPRLAGQAVDVRAASPSGSASWNLPLNELYV